MAKRKSSQRKAAPKMDTRPGTPVIVRNLPPGREKFSAVLLRFAAPLLEDVPDDYDEFKARITIAVIAWNLSRFSQEQRLAALMEIMNQTPLALRQQLKQDLDMLIQRKYAEFAGYTWPILDFWVREEATEFRVEVLVGLG